MDPTELKQVTAATRAGFDELASVAKARAADCVAGKECAAALAQALVDIASDRRAELGEAVNALAQLAETAAPLSSGFSEIEVDWERHRQAWDRLSRDWAKFMPPSGNGSGAGGGGR